MAGGVTITRWMMEPTTTHDTQNHRRPLPKRGRIILSGLLLVLLVQVPVMHPLTPLAPRLSPEPTGSDWTMYHADPARTGYVAGLPNPTRLTRLWTTRLDGAVYAEPLVVAGRVVVATENDTLYALDARTGRVQWRLSVGAPVPLSALPCGDIDPLGITGTPVYDPGTSLVFAVAEITGPAHILVGVDVKTGHLRVRRAIDPPGTDPQVEQQRGALALWGNRVYVAFGGLYGDCGNYHGLLVAARTDGKGALLRYQVPTPREGGIWAPPGPVIDTQGKLYVTVGNGAATQGRWDHSDAVLRLSPTLQLEDGFAPASWPSDNAADLDLGSLGPVLLPHRLLYADGKAGQGYLLRAGHLGGIGGQIQTLTLCSAYGGAAVRGSSLFLPCSDGLRQLTLTSAGRLVAGWRAPQAVSGSPVIGGQTIYSLDPGGALYALDAATGRARATLAVGATSRFATPTLSGRRIFIGTLSGVVAVGPTS
jgi:outer membrane protein assembly factor BamB